MGKYSRLVCLFVVLGLSAGCPYQINWHFITVEDGAFYRSAQMSGGLMRVVARKYEIATVINFRGRNPDAKWYRDEVAACKEEGVAHHDIGWSASRLPLPASLTEYIELIKAVEKPILVHCEGGTHRAGVGAACYLLTEGATVDEARGQFGLFFANAPIGRLLDLYEGSPLPFGQWAAEEYPGLYAEEK